MSVQHAKGCCALKPKVHFIVLSLSSSDNVCAGGRGRCLLYWGRWAVRCCLHHCDLEFCSMPWLVHCASHDIQRSQLKRPLVNNSMCQRVREQDLWLRSKVNETSNETYAINMIEMWFSDACRCGATSCTEDCSSTAVHSRLKRQLRPCELEHDAPHAGRGVRRAEGCVEPT